jgi:ribosomal protein L24E
MDCNFCGRPIPKGTEFIHVTSKGKAMYFCASKCLKATIRHNKKPRETKWTKSYVDEKASRLKTMEHKAEAPKQQEKPQQAALAKEEAKKPQEHKAQAKEGGKKGKGAKK